MTERISEKPEIPFVVTQMDELQQTRPNDWVNIIVDIYDERTILAAQLYKTLLKVREEKKIF